MSKYVGAIISSPSAHSICVRRLLVCVFMCLCVCVLVLVCSRRGGSATTVVVQYIEFNIAVVCRYIGMRPI